MEDISENFEIRDRLMDLEAEQNYDEAIKETTDFLKSLKRRGNRGFNRWFCYYQFARYDFDLGEYKKSLTNLKKAEIYCNRDEFKWNMLATKANVYEKLGEFNKAIKVYKECAIYYKTISLHQTYAVMLANIGHLQGNSIMIQRAINIFKKCENTWNYDNILDEMKSYLKETITRAI